jgi:hypothetical protein
MNVAKYIGMDVHTATTSAAVWDSSGNLVMEATLEAKAETILEFLDFLQSLVIGIFYSEISIEFLRTRSIRCDRPRPSPT